MSRAKYILFALVGVLLVIQLIRPARNQSGQVPQGDISKTLNIPDDAYTILKNACYDCHSNNTSYPWYFSIQPVGWILARDIENGKAEINFSEFGSLASRRQISKLQGIANQIEDGTMPLPAYQFMHASARLTEDEKRLLLDWIETAKDTIASRR